MVNIQHFFFKKNNQIYTREIIELSYDMIFFWENLMPTLNKNTKDWRILLFSFFSDTALGPCQASKMEVFLQKMLTTLSR